MKPTFNNLAIDGDGDGIASLVLSRPDKLNALSRELLVEIPAACDWLNAHQDIKVVVVYGHGDHFSAGFDLDDFADTTGGSPRESADLGRIATESLANTRAVTIAAIDGYCIGGGVVLASACDLRLASSSATFRIPEVDLGIPLAWGGIPRLVREIGPAMTKELVLTCRSFDAAEAKQIGFLNRIIDARQDHDDGGNTPVVGAALQLAAELAAKPGFALRSTKQYVNAVTDEIPGTARSHNDADTLAIALTDPESRAVAAAYLADRGRRGT